ncbi:MAG: radical SAM protein [Candidatus Sericytochromatia bacterium]
MSELTNNLDFSTWIKTKKDNDYWYVSDVPYNYGILKFHNYTNLLKNNQLKCKQVTIFVTNRCDLACLHCGVSANERQFSELTLENFEKIILPKLKTIGVEYITLSGGEPFLRKDIVEIITLIKKEGFKLGIVSNGSKIKKNFKKLDILAIPDTITISIDGLEKNHTKIRKNKTNFKKAIEAITILKQFEVPIVAVSTCIYPYNLNDLEELKKIIFNLGADKWILRPISPSGRASDINDYYLTNEQLRDLLFYIKNNVENNYDISIGADIGYLGKLDSYIYLEPYFSSTGWDSMIILPNGDIKGFDEIYLPKEGNILIDDIEKIWKEGFKYYREPELPDDCLKCEYFTSCRGGYISGAEMGKRCIKPVLKML